MPCMPGAPIFFVNRPPIRAVAVSSADCEITRKVRNREDSKRQNDILSNIDQNTFAHSGACPTMTRHTQLGPIPDENIVQLPHPGATYIEDRAGAPRIEFRVDEFVEFEKAAIRRLHQKAERRKRILSFGRSEREFSAESDAESDTNVPWRTIYSNEATRGSDETRTSKWDGNFLLDEHTNREVALRSERLPSCLYTIKKTAMKLFFKAERRLGTTKQVRALSRQIL
jgi:hypothetical protein